MEASTSGGQETFHKMSKKIAQLTKVIFHLNTKNDESDVHVKSVQTAYEQEIELVLKAANAKVGEAWALVQKTKTDLEQAVGAGGGAKTNML